jgi:putative ABC transport system permease protein
VNHAQLVVKNLGRRKLRTILMLVAIFIAFFLYGGLETFNRAFHSQENSAAADRLVTVNRINFTMPLPISYVDRVRQTQGVVRASYNSWFGGYYREPREFLLTFAVDPESYLAVYPSMTMPAAQRQAFIKDRIALCAGKNVAAKYNWKVGDHIPISSNIYSKAGGSHTWEFNVAAIYASPAEPTLENLVLIHHDYFDETVTFGRDTVNWIGFTTASPKLNDAIAKTIDAGFANSPYETTTTTAAVFNRGFTAQFGNITLIITLVVSTAFAAILMIVGNTMVMAVRERTREIGVLKTLGFRGEVILAQILAESTLLAVGGALLGLGAAALVIRATSSTLQGLTGGMQMELPTVLAGLGWALALGLVTGAAPAWSGMRLRIVTALGRR